MARCCQLDLLLTPRGVAVNEGGRNPVGLSGHLTSALLKTPRKGFRLSEDVGEHDHKGFRNSTSWDNIL